MVIYLQHYSVKKVNNMNCFIICDFDKTTQMQKHNIFNLLHYCQFNGILFN